MPRATRLIAAETLEQLLRDVERAAALPAGEPLRDLAQAMRAARGERRLRLVVVGEFGVGKSLVLDSLLGEAILPVGPAPTTSLPVELHASEVLEVALVTPEGMEDRGGLALLADACPERYVRVRIGHPSPWLREFVMVDTPGLGEPDAPFPPAVEAELRAADVILFVLHAQAGVRQTELRALAERVRPQGSRKLIILLNQIDWIPPEKRPALLAHVRQRLAGVVAAPVIGYSAMAALRGDADSGRTELERLLREEILADARRLAQLGWLARLRLGLEAVQAELATQASAHAARRAAAEQRRADREAHLRDLGRRLEEARDRVFEHLCLLGVELEVGATALGRRLQERLPELVGSADAETLRRALPGYLDHVFRGFLERQYAVLRERLLAVVEEIDRELTGAVEEPPPEPAAGTLATALRAGYEPRDPFTRAADRSAVTAMLSLLLGETARVGFVALAASEVMRRVGLPWAREHDRQRWIAAAQSAIEECVTRAHDAARLALAEFEEALRAEIDRYGEARRAELTAGEPAIPPEPPELALLGQVEALLARTRGLEAALAAPREGSE